MAESRHTGLVHEYQVHVTGNHRQLFDGGYSFRGVVSVWHALGQSQIDKKLKMGLPESWLTN